MGTTTARPSSTEWDGDATEATDGDDSEPTDDGETTSAVGVGSTGSPVASLSVPDDATDEEVAAIAAAVQAHLQKEERSGEEASDTAGDRWNLSTRMLQNGRMTGNIPPDVPADSWVAAGRIG